jgi:antirestriction protein
MCEMKAYITNLGKYTEGELVGKWISFPIDEDDFQDELESIGVKEDTMYEEWFITDYDCSLFDMYDAFGEYPNIDDINEVAEALEDHESEFTALMEVCSYTDALGYLESENYTFYEGMTLEDVAYEIVEECYNLPEIAQRYFDYKAFARDLGFDGYCETSNGVIYTC